MGRDRVHLSLDRSGRIWPREGEVLLRASLGRFGDNRADAWSDAEVVERVWDELGALIGVARRAAGGAW